MEVFESWINDYLAEHVDEMIAMGLPLLLERLGKKWTETVVGHWLGKSFERGEWEGGSC